MKERLQTVVLNYAEKKKSQKLRMISTWQFAHLVTSARAVSADKMRHRNSTVAGSRTKKIKAESGNVTYSFKDK